LNLTYQDSNKDETGYQLDTEEAKKEVATVEDIVV